MKQLVIIGLAVPLICTLALGWLQWSAVNDMLKVRELVRHIRAVQLALGEFRYSLSDAESCQFRYILNRNDANIVLYRTLMSEANNQIASLRSLTTDTPSQQKYLAQIEPLLAKKVADTEQSITLEKNGDHAGALQIAGSEDARQNMLQIEGIVDVMLADEIKILLAWQNVYSHNFKVAGALSVLSMALCLLCIIAILLLLRRLTQMQSRVTLSALTEMLEYEGGSLSIEDYLKRRQQALNVHGQAQIEAERILALLEHRKLRPTSE